MAQRLRRVDPALLAVLAVAALALWPFLSRPGLPRFTDAELHVYRLAELARLVAAGEIYPRWAPSQRLRPWRSPAARDDENGDW